MFNFALASIVRISTSLLYAGVGEMILERAGIINIGIEGVMLAGAFSAFSAAWISGSPIVGAFAGMVGGILLMLLFSWMVLYFSADQIVTGMALNLFALGLTGTAKSAGPREMVRAPTFEPVLPNLADVPVIGPLLFTQTPMTWLALGLLPLLWYYMERSERGLELRAVGENPAAAEASGISVIATRWKACIAAGALGGLGGAFLTISQTASFAANCTKGRGFVALAAVVLGRYGTFGTAAACFFFGAAFYARDAFPEEWISSDVIEMLPYVLTVIALCLSPHVRVAPAGLGKPYAR